MRQMLLVLALGIAASLAGAQPYLVVVPGWLRAALEPLLVQRRAQRLAVEVLELDDTKPPAADELRAAIHARIAKHGPGGYVLLAGDSQRGNGPVPTLRRPGLPKLLPGMPGAARVCSDLGFVDTDDDGLAEWCCGRVPARDAAELARIVAKVLAYERVEPGPWQHELELVAGDGDFGLVVDTVLSAALRQLFAEELPAGF